MGGPRRRVRHLFPPPGGGDAPARGPDRVARGNGASEGEPITPDLEERLARFCAWSRAIVTAVLLDLDERGEVVDPYQALTYLLTRHVPFAKAAAAWSARAGMAAIQQALCELPGYALVLLATSPNDTVERFMARDAFWSAVMKRS
jgi:hypothetical protein